MAQCLARVCPGVVSRTPRHIWVEFLYSSPRGSSASTPVFPSPQKPTFLNFNSILECTGIGYQTSSCEFLGTPWVNKLHIYIFFFHWKTY